MLIIACGLLLFVPYLGEVHLFDWDELNFAESSREMLVTGDYFTVKIDYSPFHEKPPLFMIVQAVSMAIFGVNEFAARLPNAILGIIILVVSFNIGTRLFDEKFGILWVLSWIGSLLPHFYFKSGIIDPYFNFFIFLFCFILDPELRNLSFGFFISNTVLCYCIKLKILISSSKISPDTIEN